MIVNNLPEFTHHLVSLTDGNDALFWLTWKSLVHSTTVLAQTYDILDNVQKAWNDFWSSGQGAAFVVGVMFGWFIKSIRP
ncbi:hypothetical protein BCD67_23225 [Oscillatoriales cyanobacterium USR001]|nr:hypothetical protein BCD67_23225 [Oscillatoriales cyanobacterium USR001]